MFANTKLTAEQKADRRIMLADAKFVGARVMNLDDNTTIVFHNKGNTVEFALSVKAPDEKKFRRKVGEYYALERFHAGETVKMARADFETMMDCVFGVFV